MKYYIPFFTVLLFFTACHKSDSPPLLKPTQNGQNVIAFTVNGQQHVYTGVPTWMYPHGIIFSIIESADSSIIIDMWGGVHKYPNGFEFQIYIPHLSLNSIYHIANSYPYQESYYENGQNDIFYPDSIKSPFIFTRFDSLVVAGNFQFYGFDSSGQTIALTNGFFDIARK